MAKKISFRSLLVLFAVGAVLLTGGVACYWQYIRHALEADVKTLIMANGTEAAADFDRAINADRHVLETIAITTQNDYPWKNSWELESFLLQQSQYNSFLALGLITMQGKVFLSQTQPLPEEFTQHILERTLQEGTYLSGQEPAPEGDEQIVIQAVTLHRANSTIGVLFAIMPDDRYEELLKLPVFGGEGFSFIIRRSDGAVMLEGRDISFANLYDVLHRSEFSSFKQARQLRQSIMDGAFAFAQYKFAKKRRFLYGLKLDVNDWYLLAELPTATVEMQARNFTSMSVGLFAFIFIIFSVFLAFILRLREYSNRQLFMTAFVDPLTGADNLNRMSQIFEEHLNALDRMASVVIFDITKFKVINDMYGYERGNQVLQRIAEILREEMLPNECFCRSAADNFVLLLSYQDRPQFHTRLNHLAAQIRRDCTAADACVMLDVAFGVYEVTEHIPFYIMMDRAYLALEKAKRSSRDKVQFYDEQDRRRILTERQVENSMEAALKNGEFCVYLQPKVDLKTGQMTEAEALVRWITPDKGIISPDAFIPVFEKNGFVLKLDMYILEQVVKLQDKWKKEGRTPVPVAVNFSRQHLNDSLYLTQMTRLVDRYQVPHELIEVELTESLILDNVELAQNAIRGLHQKGFSVVMDDFGSGYSSLNVLKGLQFDGIKLDKEFLNGFDDTKAAKQVIIGAVEMIKKLGVKVIAEGVETTAQVEFFRSIGCDLGQGYYFDKPLPVEEFEKRLLSLEK